MSLALNRLFLLALAFAPAAGADPQTARAGVAVAHRLVGPAFGEIVGAVGEMSAQLERPWVARTGYGETFIAEVALDGVSGAMRPVQARSTSVT